MNIAQYPITQCQYRSNRNIQFVAGAIQAQLRNIIPEMLRFSTGKSKPGWGKPECRPLWWPPDVPWANVRSDVRDEEEKKLVFLLLITVSLLLM